MRSPPKIYCGYKGRYDNQTDHYYNTAVPGTGRLYRNLFSLGFLSGLSLKIFFKNNPAGFTLNLVGNFT
jgi:hypothetical protein